MKAFLIKISLLAAVIGLVASCAGIEGTASMPICVIVGLLCLGWLFVVSYANGR